MTTRYGHKNPQTPFRGSESEQRYWGAAENSRRIRAEFTQNSKGIYAESSENTGRCQGDGKELAYSKQAIGKLMSMLRACQHLANTLPTPCLEYAKSMPRVCQEYAKKQTFYSHTGNKTFPYWEQNIPTLGIKTGLRLVVTLLLMIVGVNAWGQTTYTYYALHKDGKGYLKQYKGIVGNDGTFRYENAYDSNGSSIWVLSSDGYLQQEMYYLNVANGKTLYLSTTPITQWDLVDDNGKTRLRMNGSTKVLGLDSNNKPVLDDNPTNKYAACTLTITERKAADTDENVKWSGPNDVSFTVQSPQLVTYLRTYYLRRIDVVIDKNDAGTTNVKVVDGSNKDTKDSRCYCSLTYVPPVPPETDPSGKGDTWDINTTSGVIYHKGKNNNDVTVSAKYNISPLNPIVRADHPAPAEPTSVSIKIQKKAFAPNDNKKYLLFNTEKDAYRFLKAIDTSNENDPVLVNGKKDDLTEAVNGDISWDIEIDDEGFCSFKNVTTNRYLYYDASDYTHSGDYGVAKIGSTTPSGTAYKFRIFSGGVSRDPYSTCYYIIPYDKQFAVFSSNGALEELSFALNINETPNPKVASLTKASNRAKWKFYTYEWQNRLWDNYDITGDNDIYTAGEHVYTATTWRSRNIKDSPKNTDVCAQPNTKLNEDITYTWEVTGLDASYITTTSSTSNGTGTLTATITLPPGTRTGELKLTTSAASYGSHTKTIPLTLYNLNPTFVDIDELSDISDENGLYRLTTDNTYSSSNKPRISSFSGTLDGNGKTISGLTAPLFSTLDGATVRNLTFDNINITTGTNVGAVCGEATGNTCIYNCGILATNSTVSTDDDGYTKITSCSSTISGSGYVGGIVGLLDGSARVINCYSYAEIKNGSEVGGIVGHNNVATTSANLKTMVMNCMFYGDITGGTSKAPVYNGAIITNRSDANGVSNFNYFWAGASYVQDQHIDVYNCALAAETRFLQRFEFFRPLLNSNRALAAWWATGSRDNKDDMMKWVLEPSQIGTAKPYPILKAPYDSENHTIKYPSVVNYSPNETAYDGTKENRNKGQKLTSIGSQGKLSVTIQNGTDGPTGASISTSPLSLTITDKDPDHFNFNYGKVQLPYYNDVGTKNYTDNKVVTGWEVTVSGGTNSFSNSSQDATASVTDGDITLTTPYNFADRKSTGKDDHATSGRIFSQGAYFDVPDGVTSITIQPHWANCVYVSDQYPDVVYNQDMSSKTDVTTVGGGSHYTNGSNYDINGSSQKVYTTMSNAVTALAPSGTVYDNAIVLVGNVHSLDLSDKTNSKPYTIMSIDLDKDNEPDYSYILRFNGRARVHPVRIDFLNVIGLGMAQKSTGGTGTYNFGIMQPYGWFEVTNTGLFRVTQFEYDVNGRVNSPIILHGGVIEQWVTYQNGNTSAANSVQYYHVGGNVWFKEFHMGVHQDRIDNKVTPHPPVSITGGDFNELYLTGLYNSPDSNYPDNAECYINGGRFGKVAGTGMQGLGKPNGTDNTGNIIWQIDNADIDEFYAGGINAAHIAEGNIYTVISNSRVDQFCGGPKFGDMNSDKKVVTNATNCTFRTFFGAGYGGNSYNRRYPKNKNSVTNIDWDDWLQNGATIEKEVFEGFKNEYISTYGGVGSRIDYQFLPMSDNKTNVARLFVDYVSFSLATTHDVTSKLTGCTITKSPLGRLDLFEQCIGNFYGGGSLGKVSGPVKSTLTNCTVEGNVFGAGYSATQPSVKVMGDSFQKQPHYDENLGAYLEAELPATETYSWEHAGTVNSTETAINTGTHKLFTTVDLSKSNLGSVAGNVSLILTTSGDDGKTIIGTQGNTSTGNVYGGGDESYVTGSANKVTVTLQGNTQVRGNVFGGGNKGNVDGTTKVEIKE